jgi:hypothetical protein
MLKRMIVILLPICSLMSTMAAADETGTCHIFAKERGKQQIKSTLHDMTFKQCQKERDICQREYTNDGIDGRCGFRWGPGNS